MIRGRQLGGQGSKYHLTVSYLRVQQLGPIWLRRSQGRSRGTNQGLRLRKLKADIAGGAKRARISLTSLHPSSSLHGDIIHLVDPTVSHLKALRAI